jgi:hypothetical protein
MNNIDKIKKEFEKKFLVRTKHGLYSKEDIDIVDVWSFIQKVYKEGYQIGYDSGYHVPWKRHLINKLKEANREH